MLTGWLTQVRWSVLVTVGPAGAVAARCLGDRRAFLCESTVAVESVN
jgi:hypothetical protein